MTDIELFLNINHANVRQAILCIGTQYKTWKLGDLLNRTDLDHLIITGYLPEHEVDEMINDLREQSIFGSQSIPPVLEFCSLDQLVRPTGVYALIFQDLEENSDILPLINLTPDYLIGQIDEFGLSSFSIWETYRCTCKHIKIVTMRSNAEPQVLDWEKKENDIEISVIFPMYNVAKYLDQCIQSVTAWKADYIEFLFINDGSPDNSREIVLKYGEKDKRIKLIDKPNGGCASARQCGLEHALGRYVGFIDPDDYIDESMYRKLLRAALIGSYDISYCGYNEYYENTGETKEVGDILGWPYNIGTTDPYKIRELITFCRVAIWRGIYKMEMIKNNNIHFYTEIRRFDDLPFKVETFSVARSVIAVDENLYYYRLARPGQDVSADDERLYVHFPIFAHLNESVANKKDQRIIDYLQLCKIQTHRYALEKIKKEFVNEYTRNARVDLSTTGSFWRTYLMARKMLGKKSALLYLGIMTQNRIIINRLR